MHLIVKNALYVISKWISDETTIMNIVLPPFIQYYEIRLMWSYWESIFDKYEIRFIFETSQIRERYA